MNSKEWIDSKKTINYMAQPRYIRMARISGSDMKQLDHYISLNQNPCRDHWIALYFGKTSRSPERSP